MMFNRGILWSGCFGYGGFGIWNYLIMGGVLLIAVGLILWSRSKTQNYSGKKTIELLKEKYVLGEITEEEYLKRKDVLNRK